MNKKFEEYFEGCGFTINKNVGYGKIGEYNVTTLYNAYDTASPLKLFFACYLSDDQKNELNVLFTEFKKNYKYSNIGYLPYGTVLLLNGFSIGSLAKRLGELVEKFNGYLVTVGALGNGYCPVCGEELGEREVIEYDGELYTNAHKDCMDNLRLIDEAEKQAFDSLPDNYGKGLLGALVGCVVAFGSAIILAMLGFLSAISGFLGMFVGEKCYTKFGGKPTVKMVITLTVLVVITMVLFVVGLYGFEAQVAYAEMGENYGLIKALKYGMEVKEFAISFYKDLAMTLIFTALGVIPSAISLKKGLSEAHKIE